MIADGYDSWIDLVPKRPKVDAGGKEKDPGASIMDMMKDMYDSGDDQMKKTLGEVRARRVVARPHARASWVVDAAAYPLPTDMYACVCCCNASRRR